MKHSLTCRHCNTALQLQLCNLGATPIANDLVEPENYAKAEQIYPLEVYVCENCRLAQARDVASAEEIFRSDYVYFSSHSTSWLDHARTYVDTMVERFALNEQSSVVEIACNDGYLLQYVKAKNIPCLGVEPTAGPAEAAEALGIEVRQMFFGRSAAQTLKEAGISADLMVANNVLAHVPDINDFIGGFKVLLTDEGVATFEVQHLYQLMKRRQFDTVYHEHFSYLSLLAAETLFAAQGLRVFDVDQLSTHGGSIRFYVCHENASHAESGEVRTVRQMEMEYGMAKNEVYASWNEEVKTIKLQLLKTLVELKQAGRTIAAYGAPAKGATLLNFCGVGQELVDFTVDRAPSKQGRYMPGIRIPIHEPNHIFEQKPDYILILPWNLKTEIMTQLQPVREWGAKFIIPIPMVTIE